MKLTKSRLKEIIKEEMLNESRVANDFVKELKKQRVEDVYQNKKGQIVIALHNGGVYVVDNIRKG